jgi:hypothetical protein
MMVMASTTITDMRSALPRWELLGVRIAIILRRR